MKFGKFDIYGWRSQIDVKIDVKNVSGRLFVSSPCLLVKKTNDKFLHFEFIKLGTKLAIT